MGAAELVSAIESLLPETTPGEWRAGHSDTWLVFAPSHHPDALAHEFVVCSMNHRVNRAAADADARLVAALRNSLPDILTDLRRLAEIDAKLKPYAEAYHEVRAQNRTLFAPFTDTTHANKVIANAVVDLYFPAEEPGQ